MTHIVMNPKSWTSRLMAVAFAASLALPGFSQVLVEESTGTETARPTPGAIDIQIGQPDDERLKINVTETTGAVSSQTKDGSQINLTPAEFRARRQAELEAQKATAPAVPAAVTPVSTPVMPTTPAVPPIDDPTTGPETARDEQVEAPSGIPVPTDLTPEDKPADTQSTETVTGSILSPEENKPEPGFDESKLFPPVGLAKDDVLVRQGVEIPLNPDSLSSAPLAITVPDVFGTTLTSGLRFFHYESRDLPRVRVSLLIEAGKNEEPAEKVGLAEITARTMRTGGAAGKSGDDIDRQLEQIGSDLEFTIDRDHVAGSMFALTDKADEAMALLADIMMKPDFEQKKFEQQIERAQEELRRQNDEPDQISRREFRKIIYGVDHPLARTPTSASISAITRDDVRAFHDARYRPSTTWIGISGDISRDDARKLVETAFGNWNRPPAEPAAEIALNSDRDTTSGVYFTAKATAQSQIRLGHTGIERQHPQVYAVNVLNSIYGTGGFSSRLMNQVRTKHGYVYGVGGGIFSDEPVGLFTAVAASKGATTVAAINEIINVTKSVIEGEIPEAELETARRDVVFTFVNQFDTPAETIQTHMLYAYRDYPEDYLKTFTEKVRAVTVADVKQAARDLLHPDRLKIYVIGNESTLDQPLNTLGEVQPWDVEPKQ